MCSLCSEPFNYSFFNSFLYTDSSEQEDSTTKPTIVYPSIPLTDPHIVTLSELLYDEQKLRKLAIIGLGVRDRVISKELHDSKGIVSASYNVLEQWRMGFQGSDIEAYQTLCAAMDKVGLSGLREEFQN